MDMWQQANPAAIVGALRHSQALPSGGWFVLGASRQLTANTSRDRVLGSYEIDGTELVGWRAGGELRIAPATCPHMGAHLGAGRVDAGGCLVCPWHGLALRERHGSWLPWRVHDDGILTWVQQPGAVNPTDAPILSARPGNGIDAVIRREAVCEPADVVANRLDPWHGPTFHPYAFSRLEVTQHDEEQLTMRVAYRIIPNRFDVEVTARFHCPDPRTITMTIVEGEGTGSVVETHATPIRPHAAARHQLPRTAIIEATIATSARTGFVHVARAAVVARPILRMLAGRLWRDDATYAERLFAVRSRS